MFRLVAHQGQFQNKKYIKMFQHGRELYRTTSCSFSALCKMFTSYTRKTHNVRKSRQKLYQCLDFSQNKQYTRARVKSIFDVMSSTLYSGIFMISCFFLHSAICLQVILRKTHSVRKRGRKLYQCLSFIISYRALTNVFNTLHVLTS